MDEGSNTLAHIGLRGKQTLLALISLFRDLFSLFEMQAMPESRTPDESAVPSSPSLLSRSSSPVCV